MVGYELLCHRTAKRELENLPAKERERLTQVLEDVAEWEQPSMHEKARHLEGQPGMFRIRAGDVRAVCKLDKPALIVGAIGKRKNVYEDIDTIHKRFEPV